MKTVTQELPKNLLIPSHIQARLGALLLEYALNHLEDISRQDDYFFAMAWAQAMIAWGKMEVAEGIFTPELTAEYKKQLGIRN
jgi:hypothetical protein